MLVYPAGIPTGGGYTIENAIWIYGTADYLQKTFTPASDNNKRYIYAFWTKGGLTGRIGYAQASDYDRIEIKSTAAYATHTWYFAWEQAGSGYDTSFPQVYNDGTAWRQHVMSIDTTAGTGNRIRMWTNGVENTGETYANGGETPINHTLAQFDNTSAVKLIEASAGDSVYFAQFVGIDGLSIQNGDNAIGDFGEFDDNGVWIPINVSGLTFGTNGFLLDFAETPGTGNGAGTDVSGNGNHFAETSIDPAQQVTDSPTDDADNDIGNYWTLNPLTSTETLTGGNLSFTAAANFTTYATAPAIPMSGKWYYEVKATGGDAAIGGSAAYDAYLGLVRTDVAIPTGSHTSNNNLWVIANWKPTSDGSGGQKENGSSAGGNYAPTNGFGDNSIIMVAIDMDNNAMWFGNDNTWAGSATASEIAAGTTTNAAFTNSSNNSFGSNQMMPYHGAHSDLATYNFGATAFAHTPPTGFKALNTANFPAPTVANPDDGFVQVLNTGANIESALATARSGHSTYMEIFKDLDGSTAWQWRFSDDTSNGLDCESTAAKTTFVAPSGSNDFVGWSFNMNATHGMFTAEVSHSTGSDTNTAHSLGSGLKMAVVKITNTTGAWYWSHPGMTSGYNISLNTHTPGEQNSTVYAGIDDTNVIVKSAAPSGTYRVIAIVEVAGFSSLATMLGNGVADGPFVHTGMQPEFMISRRHTTGTNTFAYIAQGRNPENTMVEFDDPGGTSVIAGASKDWCATGFKQSDTSNDFNQSGIRNFIWAIGRATGGDGVAQARAR